MTSSNTEKQSSKVYQITGLHDDAERITFMFTDFPPDRNLNPKHWESKLKFWRGEIENACRFLDDFCVSCEKLQSVFQDKEQRSPKCLMKVVGELHQSNELHLKSSYTDLIDNTWGQWSYNLAKKSTSWVVRKALYGGFNEQTDFLLVSLLEENSSLLLEKHYKTVKYERTDNVVPWNVMKQIYKVNNSGSMTEEKLVCIVGYLKSKGKCKVGISDTGEKIVKFKHQNQKKVDAVEDIDFQVVKLKKAIAKLHLECNQVEKELKKFQESAQLSIRRKEKDKAKRFLIQKNKVNKNLQGKQNALFAMREQLRMVQDAESTKMITEALSSSSAMLNQTYKEQGLTVENVEDVLDQTAEVHEMIHEIDDALSSGLERVGEDYDMDELDRELEDLKSDSEDTFEPMVLDQLPDVPTLSPQAAAPSSSSSVPVQKSSGKKGIKRVPPISFEPAT